jgi:hypothetical protein
MKKCHFTFIFKVLTIDWALQNKSEMTLNNEREGIKEEKGLKEKEI